MRKNVIRIIIGIALVFCLTALPAVCTYAAESMSVEFTDERPSDSYYTVKVKVDVTEDADGWNDAYITIRQKGRSGTQSQTDNLKIEGLTKDFDTKSVFSYEKKNIMFPGSVEIYTDFGGGATWRSFQADVTVYINGVNVASKHITAKSKAFSSSNTMNTITIDASKYPYPVSMYVNSLSEKEIVKGKTCSKLFNVSMVDQYGASWNSEEVTLTDSTGADLGNPQPEYIENYVDDKLKKYYIYYAKVNVKGPDDKKITYTWSVPTGNSLAGTVTAKYDVSYKFQHKADLIVDGKTVRTLTGTSGDKVVLDFPDIAGDGYDLEWELEGGGILDTADAGRTVYVFGKQDGRLTGKRAPYSFTVVFDGNGAAKGTMASRIQRVGTTYTLPGNTFTNTGYDFAGWNTQQDGSGQAIPNKGTVTNLSTAKGDTVTLYAQWKPKMYTVTFVNKMTGERMTQEVAYGQDAVPPEIEPFAANEKEHYIFSKWNKSYSAIKSKITVTSVHEKEPHDFAQGHGEKYCTVCGYRIQTEPDKTDESAAEAKVHTGELALTEAAQAEEMAQTDAEDQSGEMTQPGAEVQAGEIAHTDEGAESGEADQTDEEMKSGEADQTGEEVQSDESDRAAEEVSRTGEESAEEMTDPSESASVFGRGSVTVILVGIAAAVCAVAAIVIIRRRKKRK